MRSGFALVSDEIGNCTGKLYCGCVVFCVHVFFSLTVSPVSRPASFVPRPIQFMMRNALCVARVRALCASVLADWQAQAKFAVQTQFCRLHTLLGSVRLLNRTR